MGTSPFGIDLPGFPGSLGPAMMASNNLGHAGLGSAGAGVGVGGEPGEGSMVGGGGLTMEDVLSSNFWESMVVPGS